jgi:hypothetical protein
MPEPLQKAAMRTSLPGPDFQAGEGGFFHGVGGENGLGDLLEVVELRAQGCYQGGQRRDQLFGRQRDADDAGGGGKDLSGRTLEERAAAAQVASGGGQAGLTRGAVGVAGIDGHHAYAAARCAQMLLVDNDGRGSDQVGGEERRRRWPEHRQR